MTHELKLEQKIYEQPLTDRHRLDRAVVQALHRHAQKLEPARRENRGGRWRRRRQRRINSIDSIACDNNGVGLAAEKQT